ncbi:MAG: hypothetical protein IPJ23_13420 [Ignavibacteriales bacterium]|nr:hypothetical protein [Ignavibacteriales bacterium]
MNIKKYFSVLIFLLVCFIYNNSSAQQAGINLSLALPQGEFGDQVDNLGYGLSGEFMFFSPKPRAPFGFGLNVGYYVYGNESRSEPMYNIPEVFLRVDRTNNLVNFHLVFELGLPTGRIRPYVQGLFGGQYLFTETSVKNENNNEEFASSTNFEDWAWSYGAGGGISILLSGDPITENGAIYLDLKGRYLFGSEAEYLKEGSVEVIGQRVIYHPSKSKIEMLTLHAGVRVVINFNE